MLNRAGSSHRRCVCDCGLLHERVRLPRAVTGAIGSPLLPFHIVRVASLFPCHLVRGWAGASAVASGRQKLAFAAGEAAVVAAVILVVRHQNGLRRNGCIDQPPEALQAPSHAVVKSILILRCLLTASASRMPAAVQGLCRYGGIDQTKEARDLVEHAPAHAIVKPVISGRVLPRLLAAGKVSDHGRTPRGLGLGRSGSGSGGGGGGGGLERSSKIRYLNAPLGLGITVLSLE